MKNAYITLIEHLWNICEMKKLENICWILEEQLLSTWRNGKLKGNYFWSLVVHVSKNLSTGDHFGIIGRYTMMSHEMGGQILLITFVGRSKISMNPNVIWSSKFAWSSKGLIDCRILISFWRKLYNFEDRCETYF